MSQNVVDLKPPAGDPELRTLAVNIKRLREQRDMTRKQLARLVGATDRQVEHWENADSAPVLRHLKRLAVLFGQTIDHLLLDPDALNLEQHAQYIKTHINMVATMTGASVILSTGHTRVRAVPDPDAPGQHSSVEIKGSVTSDGVLHGFEHLAVLPEDIPFLDELESAPDEEQG